MLAASSEPSAEPAPTSVCSSSMNTMEFWLSINSFMMVFSRSSNWPRYFVPATINERSRERMRLSARNGGTSPSAMRCATPSTLAVWPAPRQNLGAEALVFARVAGGVPSGAGVLVAGPLRFFRRHVKDALAFRAKRRFDGGRDALADGDAAFDLLASRFDRALLPQETVGQRFVLAHQAEQQMLRLDVRAAILAGFVPRKKYDASRFLCATF